MRPTSLQSLPRQRSTFQSALTRGVEKVRRRRRPKSRWREVFMTGVMFSRVGRVCGSWLDVWGRKGEIFVEAVFNGVGIV